MGAEVFEVAGKETVRGRAFWLLRNRDGTVEAVSPARDEDAEKDRGGCLGLFIRHGATLVKLSNNVGYYAYTLDQWLEDATDAPDTGFPDDSEEDQICAADVAGRSGSTSQEPKVPSGPAVEPAIPPGAMEARAVPPDDADEVAELTTGDGAADLENEGQKPTLPSGAAAEPAVPPGAMAASVFQIVPNKWVRFRLTVSKDRRLYASDESGLPALLREDPVFIRPRREGEEEVWIGGHIMCDLVAWYSRETESWTTV